MKDKFIGSAPVTSFAANGYGLHDTAGYVWECADYYNDNITGCNDSRRC